MRWIVLLWLSVTSAWAEGEPAGKFDYYVLSLSWSPTWCTTTGNKRGSEQCDRDRKLGWVMHGLWPQYDNGWPSYCPSGVQPPSRAMTAGMADIMGTGGSAWYQWKKHGVCAGLTADDYFATARRAFDSVTKPPELRHLRKEVTVPANVIEEAFLNANPDLGRDMVTITCSRGRIAEARICLSKDLEPMTCGQDVIKDCTARDALLAPIP